MLLYVDANFASPYALVAFVSLLEKGVSFDMEPLDLAAHANRGRRIYQDFHHPTDTDPRSRRLRPVRILRDLRVPG